MMTRDKNTGLDLFNMFFNDLYKQNFAETNSTLPATNIKETDKEFIIELAVPGKDKKDFNIELNNNVLVISSEVENKKEEEKDNYTRREYYYGSFQRSFTLPEEVEAEKISAEYVNGELKIHIPKKEEKELAPKKIDIK